MLHPETPPAARALGLAGLVPFWVAALAVVFAEGEVEAAALRAQVAYGAVILTFLGDRMEMAHSIEGRVPFLDHHVAHYAARVPISMKLKG